MENKLKLVASFFLFTFTAYWNTYVIDRLTESADACTPDINF
jgi:ABC-type glycerol-3-phosphate transport system permease component